MGTLNSLREKRVYLDANLFIYAIEGVAPWAEAARDIFKLIESGETQAVSSELSLAECLVMPLRLGKTQAAEAYEKALRSRPGFTVVPVDRNVLREASQIRANVSSVRLSDAIHAATARLADCDVLLTNDRRLEAVPGLRVALLAEFVYG